MGTQRKSCAELLSSLILCLTFMEESPESTLLDYVKDPDDDRSFLGKGSFGSTFRMKNRTDNTVYAVKVLVVRDLLAADVNKDELLHEAKILELLNHSEIVKYQESFIFEKEVFVVMELVTGGTIAKKIKDDSVNMNDIAKWFYQIANALCYLHFEMKIKHRDIKPENIMLTESDNIKLIDFGLASIIKTLPSLTVATGTPIYFSFEKAMEMGYDGRDDVWATGCVMAELMTKSRLKDRGGAIWMFANPAINDRRLKLISDCEALDAEYGGMIGRMLEPQQEYRCNSQQLVSLLSSIMTTKSVDSDVIMDQDNPIEWFVKSEIKSPAGERFNYVALNTNGTKIVLHSPLSPKITLWDLLSSNSDYQTLPFLDFLLSNLLTGDRFFVVNAHSIFMLDSNFVLNEKKPNYQTAKWEDEKIPYCIAAAIDGSKVMCSCIGGVYIYDLKNKAPVIIKETIGFNLADMDTLGSWVICCNRRDKSMRLYNASSGELETELRCTEHILNAKFSNDGLLVMAGCTPHLVIWKVNGDFVKIIKHDYRLHNAIAWSCDSTFVLSASNKVINVWNRETGDEVQQLPGEDIISCFFSNSGSEIFVVEWNKITVWSTQ